MEHEELLPLILQVVKKDSQAFEKLYAKTSGHLYAIALKMLKNKESAEEAIQEAFVSIWYKADQYKQGQGTVLTWMVSIVRYRALDILRHKKVRKENTLDDDDLSFYEQSSTAHSGIGEDTNKIDLCMDELELQQRQAIHLAYFNGLSHAEVVEHLNKPLGTIKSWIRRGLQSLQRCLSL